MLDPFELLNEVMKYAKNEEHLGYVISKKKLWDYIKRIDPDADIRNMYEVIDELDARGWLLTNSQIEIKFDPACF